MFCGKCGSKNADDAMYCVNCGAKLRTSSREIQAVPVQNEKHRKVGIIAVVAVVIAAALICFFLFGGRSYKKLLKMYGLGTGTYTAENIEDMVEEVDTDKAKDRLDLIPDKVLDYWMDEEGYDRDDIDMFLDEAKEGLQELAYYMDELGDFFGEGWEMTVEISDVKDIKGSSLEDIKEFYEDMDVKVSAAKNAEIEITVTGNETRTTTEEIPMIKVGRSWYLDVYDM